VGLADRLRSAVDALGVAKREKGLDDRTKQTYRHLTGALYPATTRWLDRAQKDLGDEAVMWGFTENMNPGNSSAWIIRAALRGFLTVATPFEYLTVDRLHGAVCAAENAARHEVLWRYGIDGGRGNWRGYEEPNDKGIVAALVVIARAIPFSDNVHVALDNAIGALYLWLKEQDPPDKGSMALLILLKGFRR